MGNDSTTQMIHEDEPHIAAFLSEWCPAVEQEAVAFCCDLKVMLAESGRKLAERIAQELARDSTAASLPVDLETVEKVIEALTLGAVALDRDHRDDRAVMLLSARAHLIAQKYTTTRTPQRDAVGGNDAQGADRGMGGGVHHGRGAVRDAPPGEVPGDVDRGGDRPGGAVRTEELDTPKSPSPPQAEPVVQWLAAANAEVAELRAKLAEAQNDRAEQVRRKRVAVETLEARANSLAEEVAHWRIKATCYGNMVHGCAPALAAAGFPVDSSQPGGGVEGVKKSVEALAALNAELVEALEWAVSKAVNGSRLPTVDSERFIALLSRARAAVKEGT